MDASVEDERLGHALRVRAASALSRRRAWADYAVSAARYRAMRRLTTLFILLALPVWITTGRLLYPRPVPPRDLALPLGEPTQAHGFSRFHLVHRVVEGETLWAIAMKYYGSASPEHIQRLRQANPLHQDKNNDIKLMLDSEIRVPLH